MTAPAPRRRRRLLALTTATGLAVLAGLPLAGGASAQAAGPTPLDVQRQVLTTEVTDPTAIDVAEDGSVFIAERTGAVKVWQQDGTLTTAGTLPTSYNASLTEAGGELEEGGVHGLLLSQDFASSREVYVYRSLTKDSVDPATGEGRFRLSAFRVDDALRLDLASERTVLEVPAEWAHCCHYGGDMHWDEEGKLLLSVGDDTSPREDNYGPRDTRPGREAFNAERTSQNPKDRRGKILRLNPDGTVPDDNPHVGDPAYDPYVYAMGFRSNYRFSYDEVTKQVFVGNVGPDANSADQARGPQGFDELEVVPPGGGTNHGWPRCIGPNRPYTDYDYATGANFGPLSCEGMEPAQVFYRNVSSDFPQLLAGFGATVMAGPVYRYDGEGALALPDSFQGRFLFSDWSRSTMYSAALTDSGAIDTASIQAFSVGAPATFVSVVPGEASSAAGGPGQPISTTVGPDGALYVAEYGSGYYNNTDSKISRLVCTGCSPDAADYGLDDVVDPEAVAAAPTGVEEEGGSGLGAVGTAAALVPLAVAGAGVVRRRRLL